VDVAWDNGAVTKAVVRSKLGNPVRVRAGERVIDLKTEAGKRYNLDGSLQPDGDGVLSGARG
jgi:hypothetical protein